MSKSEIIEDIKKNLQINKDKYKKDIEDKIQKVKEQFFKWIIEPKNSFIYKNINIHANKIKIENNKKLKIGNIKIYYKINNDDREYELNPDNATIIYSSFKEQTPDDPNTITNFYYKGIPKIVKNSTPSQIVQNKTESNGNLKDHWYGKVIAKCESDHQLIGCSCDGETCNGSYIDKDENGEMVCIANNKKNGLEITAKATCIETDIDLKHQLVSSDPSDDHNLDFVECQNPTDQMISCGCEIIHTGSASSDPYPNDICNGSNIKKEAGQNTKCEIYKNTYYTYEDSEYNAKAKATCINASNIIIKNSNDEKTNIQKEPLLNNLDKTNKELVNTGTCGKNEQIIGCRCVPDTSNQIDSCIGTNIDFNKNKCQTISVENQITYPDITCLKFDNEKECLKNYNLENEKRCETGETGIPGETGETDETGETVENQFIIIQLDKHYNLSKIEIINNIKFNNLDTDSQLSSLTIEENNDFLPIKISLMNNNQILVIAKKDQNNKITIVNNYPSIPIYNDLYKNFYDTNLETKGITDTLGQGSYKEWNLNLHDEKIYSYASINNCEESTKKKLIIKHPRENSENYDIENTCEKCDLQVDSICKNLDLGLDPTINPTKYKKYTQYFKDENNSGIKSFCRCPINVNNISNSHNTVDYNLNKNNYILCTPISKDRKYFEYNNEYKIFKNLKKPCYEYSGKELFNYNEPKKYSDCKMNLDLNNNINLNNIDAGFCYNNLFYFFKNIRIDEHRYVLWITCELTDDNKFEIKHKPEILRLENIVEITNIYYSSEQSFLNIVGFTRNSVNKILKKFNIEKANSPNFKTPCLDISCEKYLLDQIILIRRNDVLSQTDKNYINKKYINWVATTDYENINISNDLKQAELETVDNKEYQIKINENGENKQISEINITGLLDKIDFIVININKPNMIYIFGPYEKLYLMIIKNKDDLDSLSASETKSNSISITIPWIEIN